MNAARHVDRPAMTGRPAAVLRAALVALAACGVGYAAAAPTTAITQHRARSLYLLHCAGCHQIDGHGTPESGVPSMIDTLGWFQRSEAGRAYLVQVPGSRNANMSDAELAAVLNWTSEAFSSGTMPADRRPYTEGEVRRWRACPPADIAAARLALVTGAQASATECRRD